MHQHPISDDERASREGELPHPPRDVEADARFLIIRLGIDSVTDKNAVAVIASARAKIDEAPESTTALSEVRKIIELREVTKVLFTSVFGELRPVLEDLCRDRRRFHRAQAQVYSIMAPSVRHTSPAFDPRSWSIEHVPAADKNARLARLGMLVNGMRDQELGALRAGLGLWEAVAAELDIIARETRRHP